MQMSPEIYRQYDMWSDPFWTQGAGSPYDFGGGGFGQYDPWGPQPGWEAGGWFDPSIWMSDLPWGPTFGGGFGGQQGPYTAEGGTPTYSVDTNGQIIPPQNQVPSSGRGGAIAAGAGAVGGVLGSIFGGGRSSGATTPPTVPSAGGSNPSGGGQVPANTPMDWSSAIMGFLNSGMNIWQAMEAMKDANWNQAAYVDQTNYNRAIRQMGLERMLETYDPLRQSLLGGMETGFGGAYGANGLAPWMTQEGQGMVTAGYNDPWNEQRGLWQDPQMKAYRDMLGGMAGNYGSTVGAGQDLLDGGGVRGNIQEMLPMLQQRAAGATDPQQALLSPMYNMLDQRGQTQVGNQAKDAFTQSLASGGYSGQLGQLASIANALASSGGQNAQNSALFNLGMNGMGNNLGTAGLTGTGADIMKQALQTLQNQGKNETSDYLSSRGKELAGENPVLPMETAASLARNEYYTRAQQQYEAAKRQLAQRGGGEGFLAGNTQDKLAEFADEILRGGASSFANTLANQQGLGLQQLNQGLNAAQAGGQLAANREGTAYSGGVGMENAAANRYGTGGNLAATGASQANQLLGMGLQTGLGADQQALASMLGFGGLAQNMSQDEISRMNLANQLFGNYQGSVNSGMDAYKNLLGLDLSALTTGGQLNQMGTQGMADLYNTGYNAYSNNLAQNLSRLGQGTSGWQAGMNALNNPLNAFANLYNTGTGGLGSALNTWNAYGNQGQASAPGQTVNPVNTNLINPLKP